MGGDVLRLRSLYFAVLVTVLLFFTGCGSSDQVSNGQKPAEQNQAAVDTAKSDRFVDVAWLKNNLNNVIVLDARADKKYNTGHIPGALNAMWQGFTSMAGNPGDTGWGVLLPGDKLAGKIGAMGIDGNKPVIVYADTNAWGEDGRIVWMLKMAGIDNSKILDGGWTAWKAAKGDTTTEVPAIKPVEYKLNALDENMNATTDWIITNQDKIKIVDSRSKKEYEGATDFGEKRGGHLPGAINIPYKDVFNDDGTVKSTQELKELFAKAGLNPKDEIAAYCTKGIRSAHMTLLLRMAGFEKARNYDASFYEWSGNEKLPLAK